MRPFYDMKSNLYYVFILKCVSIANVCIEHYMEGVIRYNKKQNMSSFSIFHTKILLMYGKIILFDAASLVPKKYK